MEKPEPTVKAFLVPPPGGAEYAEGNLREVYRTLLPGTEPEVLAGPFGEDLLTVLHRESEGATWVWVGFADGPFYSVHENRRLWDLMLQYDNDWGFGENHPPGVVFDIIRREALPVMENLRAKGAVKPSRSFFQDILLQDVNLFDLENLYSESVLRPMRLSLYPDSLQDGENLATLKSLLNGRAYNRDVAWADLAKTILANRNRFRTRPKYVELEVSTDCGQACVICPRTLAPPAVRHMAVEDACRLVSDLCAFAPRPVIGLTGMGDAATHPRFLELLQGLLNLPVESVVVETSGVEWTPELADGVLALAGGERLTLIFSVDAVDPELHRKLRPGRRDLDAFLPVIENLLLRRPAGTWVQLVKTLETVDHMLPFHRYFEKFTRNILIQKYNPYRGVLPERRIHPATPFETIDCWHLKRELVVRVDGTVPVCKQDLGNAHVLGNVLTDGWETVWKNGQSHFEKHVAGWDFCRNCDEHYTYNF